MKEQIKKGVREVFNFIQEVWGKLPAEIKVGVYYILATALLDISNGILDGKPIDFEAIIRLAISNIIVVFVKNIKARVEKFRAMLG